MRKMKRKYKICIWIWLLVFAIIFLLDKADVHFRSPYIHIFGTLLCFLPIFVLFVLMSKDGDFSPQKRTVFKVIYIYLTFCYVGGVVAKYLL